MFDRFDVRYKIAFVWVIAFIALWITFQSIYPVKSMEYQLNRIEQSIEVKNWAQANKYTSEFRNTFKKYRLFIQMNNSTEALTTFEHTIGQLDITVKHHKDSALEYIGALRAAMNLVVIPFSGP